MTTLRVPRALLCFCTFLACAEAPPARAPKPPVSPAARQRLDAATVAHREVQDLLAAAAARDRETCEFQVGDCSLLVKEQESSLLGSDDMSGCQVMPDAAARTSCIADRLVAQGQHQALSDYYAFHDSCTRQVLTCVEGLSVRAAASAAESRVRARREEVERAEQSVVARARVEGAKAAVGYLRATLPPAAETSCDLSEAIDTCRAGTQQKRSALEAELRSDSFDAARSALLAEELSVAEAECLAPEVACLEGALSRYGLFPEAKKVVARNLELLVRREELKGRASPRAVTGCLGGSSREHQARIVSAYVAYVREPVLYFRRELDRAFRDLHESQVGCLTARAKSAPAGVSARR